MQTEFYTEPRAFLISDAAKMLIKAHQELSNYGYGIVIYDAYRPWFVTKMFWEATPDSLKNFVAESQTPGGLNWQGVNELRKAGYYKSLEKSLNNILKRVNKS